MHACRSTLEDPTAGQQALELLAARASRAPKASGRATPSVAVAPGEQTGGWPEFSEFSCFSCHHDMTGEGVVGPGRRSGALPWGTWYFPVLAGEAFPADTSGFRAALAPLRRDMIEPYPDPVKVADGARKAAAALEPLLGTLQSSPLDPRSLPGLMAALAREGRAETQMDWDRAAQLYLALAALYHAQGDLAPHQLDPRWRSTLQAMVDELKFPPRKDSPGMFGPSSFQELLLHLGQ